MQHIQLDVLQEDPSEDQFSGPGSTPNEDENKIPVEDITETSKSTDGEEESLPKQAKDGTSPDGLDVGEEVVVEEITVDDFLDELPDDGDPSSSTLASILTKGQAEAQIAESLSVQPDSAQLIPSAAEWIPIHATRLLIENTDLNDEIIDSLLEIAEGASESLVKEFVDIFGHIKTAKVLPFLEQCLKQGNRETRLAALHSLKEVALPVSDQDYIRDLLAEDDPLVRQRALELLVANDADASAEYLKQAFMDDDRQVCITAMENIGKENLNDDVRTTLIDLLMKSGGELTRPIAQILRRVEDSIAIRCLLEKSLDQKLEDYHWIFINALTEAYAHEQAENPPARDQ